ncbi:MAG: tRNA lysidine(34) synthetase TilS [Candidatus Thermofonsia Clade 1 bacterium]|jgi:tRNA(Ile)-lysidine synthetase-like protein|uniref:tRNA(Ile)-lysidine synthase n=1 Tax=Candidatus Thermofonsia Clade 1 bacterium TaxID=2364210 RepID=A0A2M8Q0G4_9CHLR|nr:MAG: tRNA lysidine(34) synthetase TilS [Candidatus Thermofonsia Clade 1 bacterium]PJF43290.1 MAG: tRNA lysidine(34) synthetase TilS [Candidatus Thermofonsia Clade 1 bacterium]RMF52195.1 MAG: tRNA lysidine(34) synthetase TilS [Chloroflexota bacterium]
MLDLQKRVLDFCRAERLFVPAERVVVAVSGGADSLALLDILVALQGELDIALHVATLDHGLRGAQGAADAAYVAEIAARWQLPCTVGSVDVPSLAATWRLGTEAAARRARYAFLRDCAAQISATCIATAHQRDDQAETVLLHLIRGSGLAGLRGILPCTQRDGLRLVRPLLAIAHDELVAYLSARGIAPREDSTNYDLRYARNKVRHAIMPLLREINPSVAASLARTAETLRDDYAALMASLPSYAPPSIRREDFLRLLPAQQRLWLRAAVQHLAPDHELSFERVEAARRFVARLRTAGGVQLGNGLWLRANQARLRVQRG